METSGGDPDWTLSSLLISQSAEAFLSTRKGQDVIGKGDGVSIQCCVESVGFPGMGGVEKW